MPECLLLLAISELLLNFTDLMAEGSETSVGISFEKMTNIRDFLKSRFVGYNPGIGIILGPGLGTLG